MSFYGSDYTGILRAIGNIPSPTTKKEGNKKTPLANEAAKKAGKTTDKSGITVALEDFTKLTQSYDNETGRSQVTKKDAKNSFFESIFGNKSDNAFKTPEVRKELEKSSYTQDDVYIEDIKKNGGLLYSKKDDDIYKSALNFAKADIGAIEKSYAGSVNPDEIDCGKKQKLNCTEIGSYDRDDESIVSKMKELDLDGDSKYLSPEEYASFVIAADGMTTKKVDTGFHKAGKPYLKDTSIFSSSKCDGKITGEEAELFKNLDSADAIKYAKEVYDKHYKTK